MFPPTLPFARIRKPSINHAKPPSITSNCSPRIPTFYPERSFPSRDCNVVSYSPASVCILQGLAIHPSTTSPMCCRSPADLILIRPVIKSSAAQRRRPKSLERPPDGGGGRLTASASGVVDHTDARPAFQGTPVCASQTISTSWRPDVPFRAASWLVATVTIRKQCSVEYRYFFCNCDLVCGGSRIDLLTAIMDYIQLQARLYVRYFIKRDCTVYVQHASEKARGIL